MEINNEFNVGDLTFSATTEYVEGEITKCDSCDKDGFILLDGMKFGCPKCSGFKKYRTRMERLVPKANAPISRIKPTISSKGIVIYYNTENYGYFKDENLFRTSALAKKECDRRNKESRRNKKAMRTVPVYPKGKISGDGPHGDEVQASF